MKKLSLLSGIFLLSSLCCNAKIWRVNNNNGILADFTTVQAAHDGAKSGDTLHLEGSPNDYGSLSSTKKLVIIGPGYFLDQNTGFQAITLSAKIQGISYQEGSAGSEVMGIDFWGGTISVSSNDIVIKRNKFSSPNGAEPDWGIGSVYISYVQNNGAIGAKNIIISQNYGLTVNVAYPSTGILITNNYITVPQYFGEETENVCLTASANAILLVQNNIFRRGKVLTYNSSVTNNILFAGFFDGAGNLVANNIGSGTQFGTTNGNKSSIDMTKVFVATGSSDAKWKLKSGSPAIGAGYGSTTANPIDCGIFGSYSTYKLSGIPPVPSIYSFENQPVGSTNDPIDVTLKVRSNN
ncbi:hypothetical protein [Dyadobacter sp. NIV53]|uniref:hypothetical protein n=1 Tax=Dyadobacter sp. NIV53 TaxID=2861765 RepID=UPI001C884748|nr:hypothetical protein [Dyadobacter sp. NIV53]